MSLAELSVFAGLAALYAGGLTLAIHAGWRLLAGEWAVRAGPAVFLTAFFLALTHHPFPDSGTLDCAAGGEPPLFLPFQFVRAGLDLWRRGAGAGAWFLDLGVSSAVMNLVICAAIGAALVPLFRRRATMFLFAAGLTGLVELSQLTGLFGLYDCPYRQFDVDDLILNVLGIALGWGIGRRSRARDYDPAPADPPPDIR